MAIVIIGGAPRSGTTLLQSILCSGSNVIPLIQECQFLSALVDLFHSWEENHYDSFLKSFFSNKDDFRQYGRQCVSLFVDRVRNKYDNKAHVVLKDPVGTHLFPIYQNFIDDPKFVISVRDPRDAVVSMLRVADRFRAKGQDHAWTAMDRNMSKLGKYYVNNYKAVMDCNDEAFLSRVRFVRNEDLVENTDSAVADLAGFVGYDLDLFTPENPWANSTMGFKSPQAKDNPFHTDHYGNRIDSKSVGRYRTELTTSEIAAVAGECQEFMRRFDYN